MYSDWAIIHPTVLFPRGILQFELAIETIERLCSLFCCEPKPVLLIGAGASVRSGIPLSADIVEIAAKWAYCQRHGLHPDDPKVVRSDWFKWLTSHTWYKPDIAPVEHYSQVIEYLLQPRQNRKDFFIRITKPEVAASSGYERLLQLLAERRIDTILTTNFDTVLLDLHRSRKRPHVIEIVQTEADYTKFSTSPKYPQLMYLHGSIEHYSDANLLEEVQTLRPGLVELLSPLLRDHPLIVVGYRGAEPSIMQHLLSNQLHTTKGFRQGIYWCVIGPPHSDHLHPLVTQLSTLIGGNFRFISIEGFDEVMEHISTTVTKTAAQNLSTSATIDPQANTSETIPFDMKPVLEASTTDLDLTVIQAQLPLYCKNLGIPITAPVNRDSLLNLLIRLDLAVKIADTVVPTVAGCLLFAKEPHHFIPSAMVELHSHSDADSKITGNLWKQLDRIASIIDEANPPFRLKDVVSETVYPYPRLALKELIVNALVHRDYQDKTPLKIDIDQHFIRLINPGGLVEQVQEQLRTNLQLTIEKGARGIKGYRNPVLADLFYGAGAMDKEGSGLPDVHDEVTKNKGKVLFGPTDETNAAFRALIYRRTESVNEQTRTAKPSQTTTRFFTNFLRVLEVPSEIWQSRSRANTYSEFYDELENRNVVPLVRRRDGAVLTFADPSDRRTGLRRSIFQDGIDVFDSEEFCSTSLGSSTFVWLLNECLFAFLRHKGLIVDRFRKRAYFPRTREGARELTYQASLRKATRTVTKPYLSKINQRVLYWEHEAIWFGFERFGIDWVLRILPGYVFTSDGREKLLQHRRISALSTRRAARDYNLQVHNDLVFWTWVLSRENPQFEMSTGGRFPIVISGSLASCELEATAMAASDTESTLTPPVIKAEAVQDWI